MNSQENIINPEAKVVAEESQKQISKPLEIEQALLREVQLSR
jgi:hypothetical protein